MNNLYYKKGSNQYRKRPKRTARGMVGASLCLTIFFFAALHFVILATSAGIQAADDYLQGYFNSHFAKPVKIISPLPQSSSLHVKVYAAEKPKIASVSAKPPPPVIQNQEIRAYVKEVFGPDSPAAFKLLSCENSALDPNIVNSAGNYPLGSRDIGVFQINEYWQKTQAKFLFNWKINVQIAHQLYVENGNSFKMWTCGRKLGV